MMLDIATIAGSLVGTTKALVALWSLTQPAADMVDLTTFALDQLDLIWPDWLPEGRARICQWAPTSNAVGCAVGLGSRSVGAELSQVFSVGSVVCFRERSLRRTRPCPCW